MSVQGPEPITPRLADALTGVLRVPSAIAGWRQRQRVSPAWTAVVAVVVAVVALPIATVLLLAINPSDNIWPHLVSTVLPGSLWRTVLLSAGVAAERFSDGKNASWLDTI
jgi:iron(III) transport system permease protein